MPPSPCIPVHACDTSTNPAPSPNAQGTPASAPSKYAIEPCGSDAATPLPRPGAPESTRSCGRLRRQALGCVGVTDQHARPPLALSRIERLTGADGRTVVRIGMKRMYSDGTHAIELTPQGLAEKLAALIPHPRVNQIIYRLTRPGATRSERAEQRLTWAELLPRVFRVDGWECPHCRQQMSLRTVVIGMPACTRILTGRGVTVEVREA